MISNDLESYIHTLDVSRRMFLSSIAIAGVIPNAIPSSKSLHTTVSPSLIDEPPDPPGAEAGRRIGNGIRAAIQTAFPAISTVIEAIWPKKKAKNDDKQTRSAVEAELEKYQEAILEKVNDNIKDVSKLVDQLDALNKFSKICDDAAFSVLRLQFLLAVPVPADDKRQWLSIDEEWSIAERALSSLIDIKVVGLDSYMTESLIRVQGTRNNLLLRVKARIGARDAAGVKPHIDQLSTLLEATRNLSTYQIGQVKVAFAALKNPIQIGYMAPPPPTDEEKLKLKEKEEMEIEMEKRFKERVVRLFTYSEK